MFGLVQLYFIKLSQGKKYILFWLRLRHFLLRMALHLKRELFNNLWHCTGHWYGGKHVFYSPGVFYYLDLTLGLHYRVDYFEKPRTGLWTNESDSRSGAAARSGSVSPGSAGGRGDVGPIAGVLESPGPVHHTSHITFICEECLSLWVIVWSHAS